MFENDNIDYSEVFGEDVSVTEADSAVEDTDADANADTSDADTSVGENGDGDDDVTGTEDSAESSNESGESVKPMQSSADNSRFAAARREAERQRDSAIAAERESSRKAIEEVFASLGLQDPYTGKPIRTKEEYDAYRNADSAQKKRDFMRENNMDERAYNSMIGELPEVRAAREAAERARIAEQNAARERAKTQLDEQIREIGTLDPSIKSIDDLTKDASYPAVFEMIKKGYKPVDAYRIANFDKLTKNASEAARQTVLNNQSGKEHLVQTTQRGTGIASVPADVRQMYRDLDPDMSDADIAKDYERYLNQTRKK
ncbi:MAG: hypothetical protein IJY93_00060 [Clostridia bacterium]|nr:hypothetical protein [Clostridia bacterium]